MHAIEGIPRNCQILHVEQEVVGDDTTALQCILNSDVERIQLLEEEASLLSQQVLCYVYTFFFFSLYCTFYFVALLNLFIYFMYKYSQFSLLFIVKYSLMLLLT